MKKKIRERIRQWFCDVCFLVVLDFLDQMLSRFVVLGVCRTRDRCEVGWAHEDVSEQRKERKTTKLTITERDIQEEAKLWLPSSLFSSFLFFSSFLLFFFLFFIAFFFSSLLFRSSFFTFACKPCKSSSRVIVYRWRKRDDWRNLSGYFTNFPQNLSLFEEEDQVDPLDKVMTSLVVNHQNRSITDISRFEVVHGFTRKKRRKERRYLFFVLSFWTT